MTATSERKALVSILEEILFMQSMMSQNKIILGMDMRKPIETEKNIQKPAPELELVISSNSD